MINPLDGAHRSLDYLQQQQADSTTSGNLWGPSEAPGESDGPREASSRDEIRPKRRVFQHHAGFPVSGLAWSNKPEEPFQLALCSFLLHQTNYIQIVRLARDDHDPAIRKVTNFVHQLPPTKILWMPQSQNYGLPHNQNQFTRPGVSLLATTSDHLRLWRIQDKTIPIATRTLTGLSQGYWGRYEPIEQASSEVQVQLECLLRHNPKDARKPVTSMDWNDVDPRLMVTTCIDKKCVLWDIEYEKPVVTYKSDTMTKTELLANGKVNRQILAHDEPPYGVSFSRYGSGTEVFISVGEDRSVRLFDMRQMSTTFLFDSEEINKKALIKINCSKQSEYMVSFFSLYSREVMVLDIRKPGELVCSLSKHSGDVNCMSWAPHSATYLSTGGEDKHAFIWNLDPQRGSLEEPLLIYKARARINAMSWSASQPDWIGIAYTQYLELLRV